MQTAVSGARFMFFWRIEERAGVRCAIPAESLQNPYRIPTESLQNPYRIPTGIGGRNRRTETAREKNSPLFSFGPAARPD
jgi:hypothetical protein